MEKSAGTSFYVGTYTDGGSKGIYKFTLSMDGTLRKVGLMARTENPSFLSFSKDGDYLLAVNEVSDENRTGYVSSFKIGTDTLDFLDQKPSGGAHPCHVVTNPEGYVVVANYSGGNMGLLKIQEDGTLSELLDVQQHKGKGQHPRQEGPHAHSGWFTKDDGIISVDLGTNQLWFSQIDTEAMKFVPGVPPTFSMEPGAGPRHLAFHPENPWTYVVNELSSSVSLLEKDSETGTYKIVQTLSTLPDEYSQENTCADIHISPDGKFLYASNRGHNSIAIFSIDPETGNLSALGHEHTEGETPRNFSLSPDGNYLLVANQDTDNIVAFRRDEQTGQLTYVDKIEAPTPVCILFVDQNSKSIY
ncbi:MAG: lactonase family protein [Robiginitalea sp.]